ncbi:ABC transporter permease [Clostridium sp. 'deep sea']|uniref:ABC transporter permease n=1 Tax=Clostridium sp. 'deep sea' TaxID=2779445 RepID=UPI0018964EE3|nr:ABC transporter permease [Clostridium sp. 'deep sea']QOR34683.1 ABC transporter permease [Clostridium sp. 'deep sea']
MIKLIKLEIKRNRLTSYYIALIIISILMLAFIYMIAMIAKVENDIQFQSYDNLLKMHTGICFIVFSVFSVVLFSKFIIEDYSRQKAMLMFSYPVSKTKVFFSKVMLVTSFIAFGFLICTLIPSSIFFLTENIKPILSGKITNQHILSQYLRVITSVFAIMTVGLISLRIGFIKKSVSTTIVTAIILSVIFGNVIIGINPNLYMVIGSMVLLAVGILAAYSTNKVINKMEV